MTPRTKLPTHRPTTVGSVLSILAGVAAVAIVGETPGQRRALAVVVVGLALLGVGYAAWHRRWWVIGLLLVAGGSASVAVGLLLGVTLPGPMVHAIELLPGLVGLALLTLGLLPVRSGWERWLVSVGTGLVFVAVVTSGVVRGTSLAWLLVAGIGTVVSWDAAEQSISLGRQLGRQAETYRAELGHLAGTAIVGGGVFVLALGVYRLDVQGLPLSVLVLLLIAGVVLSLALHD